MHTVTLVCVSAFKGPSPGITDTFYEQGQQNARPDVNIRLKSSFADPSHEIYQYSLRMAP